MIHNEKCDNCLCRTVCHFTFPGYELTEEDGECGHYICKKDIEVSALKNFVTTFKSDLWKYLLFSSTAIAERLDKHLKETIGEE